VAGRDRAGFDRLDRKLGQTEETDALGNRNAVLPDPLAEGFLGQAEVTQQPLNGARLFDGVEVGALQVLDQRQLQPLLEAAAAAGMHDDRNLRQAGDLGSAEPPFAGDQLIARKSLANQQRLQDAVDSDGVGEFP